MAGDNRGDGGVYQRADGRWVAAIQHEGRRRTAYGRTETEARAKLRALRAEVRAGTPVPVGRHTVRQLCEAWLNHDTSLKETTRASYWQYLRLYILPALGGVPLSKLTTDRVQAILTPLTPSNAFKVHLILHRACAIAVRWKWLRDNPCNGTLRARYEPKPRELWSAAEAQTFLAGIAGHRLEPLFVLLLSTGLRIGEALALTWDDVGLGVAVNVNGSLYRLNGEARVGKPKTRAGQRTVVLPPRAIEMLQAQRIRQSNERARARAKWVETGFVFTTKTGKPLHHSVPHSQLQRWCAQFDLPAITLHGLRHIHASLLIEAGVPIPAVSARLGHANPAITMKVYSHALPGQDQLAAAAIEAALERVNAE